MVVDGMTRLTRAFLTHPPSARGQNPPADVDLAELAGELLVTFLTGLCIVGVVWVEASMQLIDIRQYREHFSGERGNEALKYAHDIRKFEIELYWKRAAYFWTFIAAALAGYFALQKQGDISSIFVVTCLGFVFSLGWYFVNRGSGAWQRNWEGHVDLLEDPVTGPLHKTSIDRWTYRFLHFTDPFPFSPSKINNILALYVVLIWLFLMARTAWKARNYFPVSFPHPSPKVSVTFAVLFTITVVAAILLFWKGQSRRRLTPQSSIELWVRTYNLPTHRP